MVASSIAADQRLDGDIRHLVAGDFVSRSSLMADPDYHTRVRRWFHDRFNETAAHQFESAKRALVPAGPRHRRRLRHLHRTDLAENA